MFPSWTMDTKINTVSDELFGKYGVIEYSKSSSLTLSENIDVYPYKLNG